MKILALETATEFCSVALLIDGEMFVRGEFAPRRHAELLLPMCNGVLADAGIARSELDAIAVGRGPGAFTGVRLAMAAAQGLGLGLDRPVIPISSLAALAYAAPTDAAETTLAIIDARMGEVYAGLFIRDVERGVRAIGPETVGSAVDLVLPDDALNIVGTGWGTYHEVLSRRLGVAPTFADGQCFPQASAIAFLAEPVLRSNQALDPADAQPVYLRDKVAMTLAEQTISKRAAT